MIGIPYKQGASSLFTSIHQTSQKEGMKGHPGQSTSQSSIETIGDLSRKHILSQHINITRSTMTAKHLCDFIDPTPNTVMNRVFKYTQKKHHCVRISTAKAQSNEQNPSLQNHKDVNRSRYRSICMHPTSDTSSSHPSPPIPSPFPPRALHARTPPSHFTSRTLTRLCLLSAPTLPFRQSILSSPILLNRLLALLMLPLGPLPLSLLLPSSLSLPALHFAEYVGE